MSTCLTFMVPLCANNYYALFASRILCGVAQGVALPSVHALMAKWSPKSEKSFFISIIWSGTAVGSALGNVISGKIDEVYGWRTIYYVFGLMGLLWCIIWFLFVTSDPATDVCITYDEVHFIKSQEYEVDRNTASTLGIEGNPSREDVRKERGIPWKGIFTNKAAIGCYICHTSYNWGNHTLVTYLPTYMKSILKVSISEASFLSMWPFLLVGITAPCGGFLCDILIKKGYKTVNVRKFCYVFGITIFGSFLFASTFATDKVVCTVLMCISLGLGYLANCGYSPNMLDISPLNGGIVLGLSNTIGTIPGIISPVLTAAITGENPGPMEWHIVFAIPCVLFVLSSIYYLIFCEATPQKDLN